MFSIFQVLSIATGAFVLGAVVGAAVVLFINRLRNNDPWDH